MSLNIIQTNAARAKQKQIDFKATIFVEPKFIKNEKPPKDKIEKQYSDDEFDDFGEEVQPRHKKKKDDTEFDIKRARHEIIRFANDGIKKIKNKKKAEINLMVKLGGKPPKRNYKNYKDLIAERKRKVQAHEERQEFLQLGKRVNGNCAVKCNNKKQRSKVIVDGISKHYGIANPKIRKKK